MKRGVQASPSKRGALLSNRRIAGLFAGAAFSLLSGGSALAHHSYAAYDLTKVITAEGTLKEFDWGAPHASMTVTYLDEAKKTQTVSATTGAPNAIVRQGFKISDFKAGIKVTLKWHPNVNGSPGGEMAALILPDGRVLRGYGFDQLGAKPSTTPK